MSNVRMRTRLAASAAGLALLSTLAACGGNDDGGGSVSVWALEDGVVNEVQNASIDRFNDTDPSAEVELQTFANDPYKDRLRTALGSDNGPDVFFNWGGGNLKEYVDAGNVEDLTQLLEDNPDFKDRFIPSVLDVGKLDGKYYGIPMRGTQPVVLYYNKAVFEDAGVEPPKTWDDLLDAVETFKDKGVTPIALAGSQTWCELMWAEYLLDRVGGPEVFQAIRDGEEGAWEQPEVVEALGMLQDLIDAGAFGDEFASVGYDEGGASSILADGDAAMHLMGTWEYTNQLSESPDFVKGGDLGYVPFPEVEGGAGDPGDVVGNPANLYSVSSSSGNVDVAEDYLVDQMASDDYVDELIEIGDVPVIKGIEDKLAETDNADHATWLYNLVLDAPSFQLSWDQDLPSDETKTMLEQLSQLFLGEQTPEGFVETMSGS
jgi:raffinose/stachyose/melibiose transport system substrate-binding protein/xylobiose transport system substrate-binding protein